VVKVPVQVSDLGTVKAWLGLYEPNASNNLAKILERDDIALVPLGP
jgi:hypothetical protein